mgnify:CR=1 FL=1
MAPRRRPLLIQPSSDTKKGNKLYLRTALRNGVGHPEPQRLGLSGGCICVDHALDDAGDAICLSLGRSSAEDRILVRQTILKERLIYRFGCADFRTLGF